MFNASNVLTQWYSSGCVHRDIRLLYVFHMPARYETHSGGIVTQRSGRLSQTICPILWSKQTLLSKVGGTEQHFAHYRRRLPAGSPCSTITALWGCVTKTRGRERLRQRERQGVLWAVIYLYITADYFPSSLFLFGTGGVFFCRSLSHCTAFQLFFFSLFNSFHPHSLHF